MDNIGKYIETVKRIYIKGELDTKKGRKILDAKIKVFNLSKEEAEKIENKLIEKYNSLEEFILDLIDTNDKDILTNDDIDEIYEFAQDLELSSEETNYLLDKVDNNGEESQQLDKDTDIIEVDKTDSFFNVVTIGNLEFKHAKNIKDYKVAMKIYSKIDESYVEFAKCISKISDRKMFTYSYISEIYSNTVLKQIIDLHPLMIKEKFIDLDMSIEMLVSLLCKTEYISEFCKIIKQGNDNFNNNVELMKKVNKYSRATSNSMAYGNVGSILLYNGVSSLLNSASDGIKNIKFKSEQDKIMYSYIREAMEVFIYELFNDTCNNLKILIMSNEQKNHIHLEWMQKEKEWVENVNKNLDSTKTLISKEDQINKLVECINRYPFNEDSYLRLYDLLEDTDLKIKLIGFAYDMIPNIQDGVKLHKLYIENMTQVYSREVNNIINNNSKNEWKELFYNVRKKFNINDNISIYVEIDYLGEVISDVNKKNTSLNTKRYIYEKFLMHNKELSLDTLRVRLNEFMQEYNISNYYIEHDIEIIGSIVCGLKLDNSYNNLLERGYKIISNRNCSYETKVELSRNLRNCLDIDIKDALKKEVEIFGEIISTTEAEKLLLEIEADILQQYRNLGKDPFGKGITCCDDEGFNIGNVLPPEVIDEFYSGDNTPLFCMKSTFEYNKKEDGFVIGRNKLYTYKYRCVDFSEIVSITYKDTPYKNNEGDIVLFSSIFINVNSGEYIELYTNYIENKDRFVKFLLYLLSRTNEEIYLDDKTKRISQDNISQDEKNETKANILELKLSGNRYYEALRYKNMSYINAIISAYELLKGNGKKVVYLFNSNKFDKKVATAKSQYGRTISDSERIVFCFDNTVFGSAKEGILFTEKGIYGKNAMEESWFVRLEDIVTVSMQKTDTVVNKNRLINTSLIDSSCKEDFKDFLYYCVCMAQHDLCENQYEICEDRDDSEDEIGIEKVSELIKMAVDNMSKPNLRRKLLTLDDINFMDKLTVAKKSYANFDIDEEPLLLYDGTSFGSAKYGYLITNKSIYYKNIMSKPGKILINYVEDIYVKSSDLFINQNQIYCTCIDSSDRGDFEEITKAVIFAIKYSNFS